MIAVIGISFCCITILYLKREDVFRFNWKQAINFWFTEMVFTIMLVGFINILPIEDSKRVNVHNSLTPELIQLIKEKSILDISLAGLEDAIFVLPLLVAPVTLWIRIPAMTVMTYTFMRGHDYQGKKAMLAKMPHVPVAYYFASRYGILTTIVAHAVNDMYALAMLKFRLWLEE